MLGVLGGMGPLATVDFLKKVVQQTCAKTDQQHMPIVTWSVPQIPDRSTHIIHGGENPYPHLRKGVMQLQSMGASVVVIPCNTAHFWYQKLIADTGIDILHIADAVLEQLQQLSLASNEYRVGLLGTSGLIKSGIYQSYLATHNWQTLIPDTEQQQQVMAAIEFTKEGKLAQARAVFLQQVENLQKRGAKAIVLGCTEIPSVLDHEEKLIDSNLALAKRCVRWFEASYKGGSIDSASSSNSPLSNNLLSGSSFSRECIPDRL